MKYDKKKFRNAVLYLAKYGGSNVGKKKLAKLLYLVDFTIYELRKKSLTGISYTKQSYGPMPEPKTFYNALDELKKAKVIDIEGPNRNRLEKIIPNDKPKMEVFDKQEKEILSEIAQKHRLENGGDLERLAQSEPPYKMVEYGEKIPYYLAFYRNSFGEMDLDD